MRKIQVKGEITIGEILTIISIVISVVALVYAWNQDRIVSIRSQADSLRQEASQTLAKIGRWEKINIEFYSRLDPYYVQASERFYKDKENIALRDFLWAKVQDRKYKLEEDLLNEQLEFSYYGLLTYYSNIDTLYQTTVLLMEHERSSHFDLYLRQMEELCLNAEANKEQTADLGNDFRALSNKHKSQLKSNLKKINADLKAKLRALILTDDDLLIQK